MRQAPQKNDDLELELPALDGEDDGVKDEAAFDGLEMADDGLDPLDDATGEGGPHDDLLVDGAEGGWLVDAETAAGLDVGAFDVVVAPEGSVLDDEAGETGGLEDLIAGDETLVVDTGEEGPVAALEELREEDLPAIDADDDGDVPDDDLFDRGMLAVDGDLRWDDRAWARSSELAHAGSDEADDSGVLAVPGEDSAQRERDKKWKELDESGRLMAAGFLPGGSIVAALATTDRARALIVRVQTDGEARIIAEIDPRSAKADDDGESCVVTFLRWDAARGCLFIGGNFGVEAYRPV